MKKILVPIDFTPASRNASEYAASLAKAFAAEIYLLHVFMEPVPASEAPVAWMITGSELQDSNEALVQQQVNFLQKKYLVITSGSAKIGYKGDTIHDMAKEIKADLVVMGMKKEKRSKILGSTTVTAVRKAKIPVLVIPEDISFVPLKYIVLALDFEASPTITSFESLLKILSKIVSKFNAAVQVFHVQKKEHAMTTSEVPGMLQIGHAFSKIPFSYLEVADEDVEHGILHYLESHPADLLVMFAYHHNIFERIFGTIHTRSMIYKSKWPLFLIPDL